MTTARVALPASEILVNVTRWAPICAADGFQVYVAVAGFPSVCLRTAPDGDPESRIASVEPSDVAERRNESVVFAATPRTAPSRGVGLVHETTSSCAEVAAAGRSTVVPAIASAIESRRRRVTIQ
jgi:hypothetical protein